MFTMSGSFFWEKSNGAVGGCGCLGTGHKSHCAVLAWTEARVQLLFVTKFLDLQWSKHRRCKCSNRIWCRQNKRRIYLLPTMNLTTVGSSLETAATNAWAIQTVVQISKIRCILCNQFQLKLYCTHNATLAVRSPSSWWHVVTFDRTTKWRCNVRILLHEACSSSFHAKKIKI